MNALELIAYLTVKQIDGVFEAARKLPADKLNWKPNEGSRSALDQLQEITTAIDEFWNVAIDRKVEWSDEKFGQWMERRSKYTDLDELEKKAKADIARYAEFVKTFDANQLTEKVEMPFPGEFTVADILMYHYWNASYHEGQITYIAGVLS